MVWLQVMNKTVLMFLTLLYWSWLSPFTNLLSNLFCILVISLGCCIIANNSQLNLSIYLVKSLNTKSTSKFTFKNKYPQHVWNFHYIISSPHQRNHDPTSFLSSIWMEQQLCRKLRIMPHVTTYWTQKLLSISHTCRSSSRWHSIVYSWLAHTCDLFNYYNITVMWRYKI